MRNINLNSKVTIIMPAYNASSSIGDSINSVINQLYTNWELIIINDCSTDTTVEIIKNYQNQEKRISLINLDNNMGVAHARNQGIKKANGKYIAFLDSDDCWTNDKLAKQIHFMNKYNYIFTYTNLHVIDENNEIVGQRIAPKKLTYNDLLKTNHIGCLSVVLNTTLAKNNLMKTIGHEDYLTWLKILKNNVIAYNVNNVLGYYRTSDSSLSSNKFRAAKWQWNIYRNELNLPILNSIYYFVNYLFKGFKKHL